MLTILLALQKANEVQSREESYGKTLADKNGEVSDRDKRIAILVQEKLYLDQESEVLKRENEKVLQHK